MAMYRCYGMMDRRGRWRSWLFAPCTPAEHARLLAEAAAGGQVLFSSAQTFAPPHGMAGRTRWNLVKEQYVGDSALPHVAPLYFDIDADGELEKALMWARTLVGFFTEGLELPGPAVRVWFSGSKGVHVMVDPAALGIQPSARLTADMKSVALELVKHLAVTGTPDLAIDTGVYSLPRMIRMPDQINPKSGLCKVELYHGELLQLSAEQIMELARVPRGSLWSNEDLTDGPVPTATQWWATARARAKEPREFRIKTARVAGLKVRPDGYVIDELIDAATPSCIDGMMRAIVPPGTRNRCELQIACWAKSAKLPFDRAFASLSFWTARNRPELSADNAHRKAESILRSVYGGACYGFSCAAARSAAHAAGLAARCGDCHAVRPRSLRQVHSLRLRHDERWDPLTRISVEESRDIIARAITTRVAAAGAHRPGHRAAGNGQDARHDGRAGPARDAGSLCHADA